MLSALASVIDSQDPDEIERILDGIVDPLGTFYRFSMGTATLGRVRLAPPAGPAEASHGTAHPD
jgi:F420-non-reducing hydrogenase small subunit